MCTKNSRVLYYEHRLQNPKASDWALEAGVVGAGISFFGEKEEWKRRRTENSFGIKKKENKKHEPCFWM